MVYRQVTPGLVWWLKRELYTFRNAVAKVICGTCCIASGLLKQHIGLQIIEHGQSIPRSGVDEHGVHVLSSH